jgi:hypothetical protein
MTLNSLQEARVLAEGYLKKLPASPPIELVILDQHTIETDFGWVFFWNSKKYIETGNFQYCIPGNGPIIVDRRDGSVHGTPSACPIEESVERYRKTHIVER